MFKNVRCYRRIRKRLVNDPSGLRSHTGILNILKTPYEVWFWAMNMVELKEVQPDVVRTPQEVIRDAEGTVFEIVDTMAYILHHLGWKVVVVSGAEEINDLSYHPTEYFVLINELGTYITLDNEYTVVGKDLALVFSKNNTYMATDWTGELPMFAIIPKSNVPYRLSENFDPGDMP